MAKREILQEINFGQRIAEEEVNELSNYFVETHQWKRIYHGEVDIVYGPKGSGKSAIYSLLLNRSAELQKQGVIIIAAENPRGTPAFKDIVTDPPTSEQEFISLWKLYFVTLIGYQLRTLENNYAKELISILEKTELLPRERNLSGMIKMAFDYVRSLKRAESVEGGLQFDPNTGLPIGVTGKITLREPNNRLSDLGYVSIDRLLELAFLALQDEEKNIWLLIDRLDVAFAESADLEQNALRALFKVYLDIKNLDRIALKIFLRSDIWKRITEEGFREASHITRGVTISWNQETLLNLVIRRIIKNKIVRQILKIDEEEILSDSKKQIDLFYRIFPKQVDSGANKSATFKWMLSRTQDSLEFTAPRELIHLLSVTREIQLRKIEVGNREPQEEILFEGNSLKEALKEVSKVRLEQTLYAEYPQYKQYLEKLSKRKTEQTIKSLSKIWGLNEEETIQITSSLIKIGFFKKTDQNYPQTFWVPFLYRNGLDMVQGSE